MNIQEALVILEAHNKWRRDNDNIHPPVNVTELGVAIDLIIKTYKK